VVSGHLDATVAEGTCWSDRGLVGAWRTSETLAMVGREAAHPSGDDASDSLLIVERVGELCRKEGLGRNSGSRTGKRARFTHSVFLYRRLTQPSIAWPAPVALPRLYTAFPGWFGNYCASLVDRRRRYACPPPPCAPRSSSRAIAMTTHSSVVIPPGETNT
jgi:hypothetical protein